MASKRSNVAAVFGGGFVGGTNRKPKGSPRKIPERHYYGVKVEYSNGRSEWAVQRLNKAAALAVQATINAMVADLKAFEDAKAVAIDQGKIQDWSDNSNGE